MENYLKILKNNNSLFQETRKYSYGDFVSDSLTLKVVCSGTQSYQLNKKEFILQPDCFLMINKGTNFESRIESSNYVQAMSISFSTDFVNDMHRLLTSSTTYLLENVDSKIDPNYHFQETILALRSNLIFNLNHIKTFISNDINDENLLEEYLHHTFLNFFEIYNQDIVMAEERLCCLKLHTKAEVIKRLNLAKDFIYCNYNDNITLSAIAKNSCLSVNHLLRTFKQAFGETPHQFLTKLRLKRANYLIKNSDTPLNVIVSTVGFECPSSFIRLYKSYYNCTPARNRKLN